MVKLTDDREYFVIMDTAQTGLLIAPQPAVMRRGNRGAFDLPPLNETSN